MNFLLLLFLFYLVNVSSDCVCTTVPCPQQGDNALLMGQGNANMTYQYNLQHNYQVVISAQGVININSLDNGTETTTCTRKYSRMLEDDGEQVCDAGHILARRLGGYGNEPLNIFPQNSTINQGVFAQFEGQIYDCMQKGGEVGYLSWDFLYENTEHTMPYRVIYKASFSNPICSDLEGDFSNK